jgi:two-component system CheB/CheR fusion protein
MSQEILDHLFSPSKGSVRRGTKNEKGTGFGLMIAKEFVEANNGEIWAESQETKGSTFHISIPLSQ